MVESTREATDGLDPCISGHSAIKSIYIAVTAALGRFLGAEIAETADAVALEKAYGVFQQEALQHPNYQLESVSYPMPSARTSWG